MGGPCVGIFRLHRLEPNKYENRLFYYPLASAESETQSIGAWSWNGEERGM
jgi:hypothetical protein